MCALTGWCLTEDNHDNSLILKIHDSLDFVDWTKDAVFLFTRNHQTEADVTSFLDLRNSLAVRHVYPVDRYFVPIHEAIKFQIK